MLGGVLLGQRQLQAELACERSASAPSVRCPERFDSFSALANWALVAVDFVVRGSDTGGGVSAAPTPVTAATTAGVLELVPVPLLELPPPPEEVTGEPPPDEVTGEPPPDEVTGEPPPD